LVLLAEDGGFFFDVTKPASYRVSGKCWVNNHAHVLRPAPDINVDWLNLTLSFADYTPFIPEPVRPKLNQAKAKRIPIPIPPLSKQRRIVARIEELTKRLNHARKVQKQAMAEVQTYLPAAIAGVFRDASDQNQQTLGQVANIIGGNSIPVDAPVCLQETDKVFLMKVSDMNLPGNETIIYKCVIETNINYAKENKLRLVPACAVIIPKRGGAIATNKKRLLAKPAVLDPNLMAIFPKNFDDIIPEYLFWWFKSFDLADIQEDGGLPQINKKHLDPLMISVPDKTEQRRIVDYLNGLRNKADQLKKHQTEVDTELESFLPALLAKAFRGEL